LSARLLPETIPEKEGLLDRNLLEGLSGRSRKRQYELAAEFGLEGYSPPAGGCLLTNPQFSMRLRDLLEHDMDFNSRNVNLLKYGRQFRLDKNTKLIVGRNESDNNKIVELARPDQLMLEVVGSGSPIALLIGEADADNLKTAAAITARYSDLKYEPSVEVTIITEKDGRKIKIAPASQTQLEKLQIK
jgi:hypothetical protein